MLRIRLAALAIAAAVAASAPASADSNTTSYTTRIEPRAVYGATQTFENGVRVTRPLPSERQVIVNPGGLTPLSLGNYQYNGDDRGRVYPGPYGYPYGIPYR